MARSFFCFGTKGSQMSFFDSESHEALKSAIAGRLNDVNEVRLQAITVEDVRSISHKECELLLEKQLVAEVQLRKDMSVLLMKAKNDICGGVEFTFEALTSKIRCLEIDNKEQGKAICELHRLVNEQREMIQVMWNAPGMPGGQEAIEKAKKSAAVFFAGE
jgi:hypothetical protein